MAFRPLQTETTSGFRPLSSSVAPVAPQSSGLISSILNPLKNIGRTQSPQQFDGENIAYRYDKEVDTGVNPLKFAGNLPGNVSKAVADLANVPGAIAETAKAGYGAGAAKTNNPLLKPFAGIEGAKDVAVDTLAESVRNIAKPLEVIGTLALDTAWGGVFKWGQEKGIIPKNQKTDKSIATFEKAKDIVTNPAASLEATLYAANGYIQENPLQVIALLDGVNKTGAKLTGNKNFDVVSAAASPITEPLIQLKNMAVDGVRTSLQNYNANATADFINDQLGLRGKRAGRLEARGIDPGKVITDNTGKSIPTEGGRLKVDEVIKNIDDQTKPGYEVINRAIKQNDRLQPFEGQVQRWVQEIDNNPSLNALEKLQAKAQLPDIISELRAANSKAIVDGNIKLSGIQAIKQQAGKAARYDLTNTKSTPAYRNAMKAVNRSSRLAVEEALPDVGIRELNRALGDMEETMIILDSKRDIMSAAGSGFFGRLTRQAIGSVVGSSAGPLGTVAGAALANPIIETLGQLPQSVRSAMLQSAVARGDTNLANIIKQAEVVLAEMQKAQGAVPLLPSGAAPLGGPSQSGIKQSSYGMTRSEDDIIASQKAAGIYEPPTDAPVSKQSLPQPKTQVSKSSPNGTTLAQGSQATIESFTKNPDKITLFRGEGTGNKGGLTFATKLEETTPFGPNKLSGTLPAGSKIYTPTAQDLINLTDDFGITPTEEQFYTYLFNKGYDALVGPDPMIKGNLTVVVNPKNLKYFKPIK